MTDKLNAHLAVRGLRGRRIILHDVEEVIDRLAVDLLNFARERIGAADVFHLALSGGSTPQALYQHLIIDPRYRAFPWEKTHLWIVDERCVSFENDKSNFKMIREFIVDHVDMPAAQVHPMPVDQPDGDRKYERALRSALDHPHVRHRLDVVLLGMGSDGHTASLFPRTPGLAERERWVVFNDGESVAAPRPRMTMTYPLINTARQIAVLVTGESKHAMLQRISLAGEDVEHFPITGVEPLLEDTTLTWYLDEPAARGPASPA